MFSLKNKKDISSFRMKKMPYLLLCICQTQCVLTYILHTIKIFFFFFLILFYTLSNDASKFCDVTSSTLVMWHDSILKEMFPPGNYKLYYTQKLLKIASGM